MDDKFLKPYDPKETESRIYKLWEESGYFNPDVCVEKGACAKDAEAFSIVLPPPNVTGTLHLGHSLMLVIEDIMVRYNRMNAKKTLWLPGTDHAAIATQSKVEKIIFEQEGKTRHDLGREEFLKRVEDFAQKSHDTIVNQTKEMGASVDWSREAYTLDEKRNLAVRTAFKKMYDDGLIYRGYRIVNWCPRCYSTLSDDEVEYKEKPATLYTFKYSKDFPISIATTRPETKLGDAAVAVNPTDERYQKYVGQTFTIDLGHGPQEIKIIADEGVDKEFGTGALGVTPAHSMVDYEMAQKNNLPIIKIIGEDGKMTSEAGKDYEGLHTKDARKKFVEWLKQNNLIEKEEPITQNLSVCYRCSYPIEPLPSQQWFINVNKKFSQKNEETSLKELMISAVKDEKIKILPERFEKTYFHWIENLRDWCISRQIWYGHRIPVWYRPKADQPGADNEIYCDINPPTGEGWEQDKDTLDTWFSSGLWTFSTLGWPKETEDLKNFHPTSVMETGYDILFFWVARMILMTTYLLGDIPFKTVYLHGLVRDEKGKKMSKSLGNVIDPLGMIEKYGSDATRISLIIGNAPGNDLKISENKIKGYKNFSNKIWNITRFVLNSIEGADLNKNPELTEKDTSLLKEFGDLTKELNEDMDNFRYYLAGEKLYHYTWHTFADIILEESKAILKDGTAQEKISRQWTLMEILRKILILLHPFMPFITEEIWMTIFKKDKASLIVEKWPRN
jgi:valyl-tRNA synthetase